MPLPKSEWMVDPPEGCSGEGGLGELFLKRDDLKFFRTDLFVYLVPYLRSTIKFVTVPALNLNTKQHHCLYFLNKVLKIPRLKQLCLF